QLGPQTFGIFDAFGGDPERQAHLSGKLAQALLAKAPDLLAQAPVIEPVDVVGRKYDLAAAPAPLRVGLLVRMEAKAGREAELGALVEQGAAVVAGEPGTALWFGVRLGPQTFRIFDAFADDGARQAHLGGQLAQTLVSRAPDLLAVSPAIEPVDVLATKLPWARDLAPQLAQRAVRIVGDARLAIEDHRRAAGGVVARPRRQPVGGGLAAADERRPRRVHLRGERPRGRGGVADQELRDGQLELVPHERQLERVRRAEPAAERRALPVEAVGPDRGVGRLGLGEPDHGDAERGVADQIDPRLGVGRSSGRGAGRG